MASLPNRQLAIVIYAADAKHRVGKGRKSINVDQGQPQNPTEDITDL